MINYDCIGIDEGCQTIFRFETKTKNFIWKKSLKNLPTARALQRINNKNVLVGFDKGYFIINIDNGNIEHIYDKKKEITSAIRLENDTTLLTGMNLDRENTISVITLDKNDEIIKSVSKEGDYVRLMSLSDDNTYLLCTNDHILETDTNLNTIKALKADGFLHAWQSLRLKDKRTLVSAGYGAFMAFFGKNGNLEKTFGRKESLPKEIEPFFYASFRLTKNNTILLANWEGHGPNNGNKGKQLIEFDMEGKYLDSTSFSDQISSLQGLLIL